MQSKQDEINSGDASQPDAVPIGKLEEAERTDKMHGPGKSTAKHVNQDATGENFFHGWIDEEHKSRTYAEQKFIALYKCRYLLAQIGTMEERRICGKKLKQMKKKGLSVI